MEEEYSSELNCESTSSDEVILHFPIEDKSAGKRNCHSSASENSTKSSISDVEPNISPSTSAEAPYLHTDDLLHKETLAKGEEKIESVAKDLLHKETLAKGEEKIESVAKDTVIARILKIVSNPEIMNGPEVYNQFNRTENAQREENNGQIQLHIISNSLSHPVTDMVLMWLVGLQNLIFQGLPNISRSCVTRLVFDPKHRNLVLIKENNVVGGICFRMFPTRDFSEIVFLVVSSTQCVQGYGTHMLNHLKDYHIKHNIHNLLTYAAMETKGYFEKQGFNSKITLDESIYQGCINFYQNSILMECQLDKRITYTKWPEVINRQRMIVQKLIEEHQKSNIANSTEGNASETDNKK